MTRLLRRLPVIFAGAVLLLVAAACGEQPTVTGSALKAPVVAVNSNGTPYQCNSQLTCVGVPDNGIVLPELIKVCKLYPVGSTSTPSVQVLVEATTTNTTSSPTTLTYTIPGNIAGTSDANLHCLRVWSNGENGSVDNVKITEVVPTGYTVERQVTTIIRVGPAGPSQTFTTAVGGTSAGNSATTQVGGPQIPGAVVTFTNTPIPALVNLGNFVWNDLNANGVQDSGEPGIAGVLVTLDGTTTTTTDASGYYAFTGIVAGTHTVSVGTPTGFVATSNGAGTPSTDSNVSGAPVTVLAGTDDTIDFGFYKLGSIGDFVWNDANANGIQDFGELGIAGVTVTLSGAASATTTTNATGNYLFSNLLPGSYTVSFTLPSGYSASPANVGSNGAIDSNGATSSVTIAGNNNITVDFGVYQPVGGSSCTYTQGYWKNHEEKWPAPYSPTAKWMQPGNITPVTWDGLMGMSVAGGNAYMQLAHQWIAATLNKQSGAPMSASVVTVLNQAKAWLILKTPVNGAVPNFKDSQATAWAGVLDNYNNGKLGTPHCD